MIELNVGNNVYDPDTVGDEETSFIGTESVTVVQLTVETERLPSLQQELIQTTVVDYYNVFSKRGVVPALDRDYSKFENTVEVVSWSCSKKLLYLLTPLAFNNC